MGFVDDAQANGRCTKVLSIVGDFTKEAINFVAEYGILGHFTAGVFSGLRWTLTYSHFCLRQG